MGANDAGARVSFPDKEAGMHNRQTSVDYGMGDLMTLRLRAPTMQEKDLGAILIGRVSIRNAVTNADDAMPAPDA